MKGVNDHEIPFMVDWALERKIDLRFIEFMPTQSPQSRSRYFISENEIRRKINYNLAPIPAVENQGPAVTYRCPGYLCRISFISAVSRSFCNYCNRIRVNSKGEMLGCLFKDKKIDICGFLSKNRGYEDLRKMVIQAINSPEFRRIPEESSVSIFKPSMLSTGG
jgi:cyclic pyranopterin phosphate synthase